MITIQDYTFEELLEKKSLFSTFMIIEKCKTKEELITRINQVIKTVDNNEENKQILSEIIKYIITPYVGEKVANQMLKEINKKGEVAMSPLTKMFLDLEIKSEKKGESKGIKKQHRKC